MIITCSETARSHMTSPPIYLHEFSYEWKLIGGFDNMAQSKRMDPYLQDSQSSFALFARGSDNPSSNSNGVVKESELSALLKKIIGTP